MATIKVAGGVPRPSCLEVFGAHSAKVAMQRRDALQGPREASQRVRVAGQAAAAHGIATQPRGTIAPLHRRGGSARLRQRSH